MFDEDKLKKLEERKKAWQSSLEETLHKKPERRDEFILDSGIPVGTVYTPLDLVDFDYEKDLGFPGEYPFVRGIQPNMYRGKFFTMRQYAGSGSAEETNRRFHYLLEQGQTGLSVAFDLPTQLGYDSDHPLSRGEVGKVGAAIDSLQDMEVLFKDIPLEKVTTSMTINSPASVILAMYIALAEKQGIPLSRLRGTIQNDVLKEYVARGTYIFPPEQSMKIVTEIFAYCQENLPLWNTISISGYHIREAGSNAVQEIAFTLANAIAYVNAAIKAGLEVDSFAPRLSFFFNAHINFFEEIAKFRAARKVWARIMKERFGAEDPRSMMLRFHTQTAGCTLTAQQPMVNIIRVAYQALSACLGGTQSLHTNSYDEALSLPSEKAVLMALRTQQVMGYETGVTDTVDPLGGSYFIERLTADIEEKVEEYIARIDELGGAVRAIEKGYMQQEIHQSAYNYQKAIEEGKKIFLGVNMFPTGIEEDVELYRWEPYMEEKQKEKLAELRSKRDDEKVNGILSKLSNAVERDEPFMPLIIEAVKAYATVGEICDVLKGVYGEYSSHSTI